MAQDKHGNDRLTGLPVMLSPIEPIDKFIGLSNKIDPLSNVRGTLKSAVNVDIDDAFNIRRRTGYEEVIAYTDITDSYSNKDGSDAYVIDNGELKNIRYNVNIDSGFTGTFNWDDINGSVFIHGSKIGLIENNKFTDLNHPRGPSPKLKVVNGDQTAGYYQVACAYRDSNGREGGISSPIVIQAENNSAIEITVEQLPGYEVSIYVSPVNGKYVYQWQVTGAATSVWNGPQHLLANPAKDYQFGCFSIPDQATSIVWHKTRLYVCEYDYSANKSIIWFSKPSMYHLFDKSNDYIVINDKVNAMINIGSDIVITTDNAIFYYSNGQLNKVASYGSPTGHPYALDINGNYFLWSYNGICKLNEFENLTNKVHELPTSPSVFSAILNQNGYRRFVNLLGDKTDAANIFRS